MDYCALCSDLQRVDTNKITNTLWPQWPHFIICTHTVHFCYVPPLQTAVLSHAITKEKKTQSNCAAEHRCGKDQKKGADQMLPTSAFLRASTAFMSIICCLRLSLSWQSTDTWFLFYSHLLLLFPKRKWMQYTVWTLCTVQETHIAQLSQSSHNQNAAHRKKIKTQNSLTTWNTMTDEKLHCKCIHTKRKLSSKLQTVIINLSMLASVKLKGTSQEL